jgi:hypothetical protein
MFAELHSHCANTSFTLQLQVVAAATFKESPLELSEGARPTAAWAFFVEPEAHHEAHVEIDICKEGLEKLSKARSAKPRLQPLPLSTNSVFEGAVVSGNPGDTEVLAEAGVNEAELQDLLDAAEGLSFDDESDYEC